MKPLTPEQEARLIEVRRLRIEGIQAAKKLRNGEAEALYHQALRLHEEVLGETNPAVSESLNQLIYFCARYGEQAETEALIERSLALLRQKPGPKHRGILQTLDGLVSYHHMRAHYDEAECYHKQVLAAREELLGLNHPRIAATLEKYAALLQETGREVEAETLGTV